MGAHSSVRWITPAEQRFLDALSQPSTILELASNLGVTRQRVHQLAERMLKKSLIKKSDRYAGNTVVARRDDSTVLLSNVQARALSALSVDTRSLTSSVGTVLELDEFESNLILLELKFLHLVNKVEHFSGRDAWMLTEKGRYHIQRLETGKKATLAPIGIKSERSINVLSLLSNQGPTRGKDISATLNLDKTSMNAFMQYLKRRGWIRKTGDAQLDPYELTDVGIQVLNGFRS